MLDDGVDCGSFGGEMRDVNNQYLAFRLCDFMQAALMASAAVICNALDQLWNALVFCLLSRMLYSMCTLGNSCNILGGEPFCFGHFNAHSSTAHF